MARHAKDNMRTLWLEINYGRQFGDMKLHLVLV